MHNLPDLTLNQYSLVYNFLSLTIAAMLAGFVFFVLARQSLAERYRFSMVVSALVVGIAGYHYFRIFNNWHDSYHLVGGLGGNYVATEVPFNDLYRYVDWFLTVPLLMVELVHVMKVERGVRGSLMTKLVIAAALMIALGYPGQNTDSNAVRALWGTLSTLPFVYLLYVLWTEVGKTMAVEPPQVAVLLRNLRLLTLATWGFYPIAYMAPFFGLKGAGSEVFTQVGYSIADITAKVGYGVMIFAIAKYKSGNVEAEDEAARRNVAGSSVAGSPVRSA